MANINTFAASTGIFQNSGQGKAVMWAADLNGEGLIGQLFVQLNSSRKELADGWSAPTCMVFAYNRRTAGSASDRSC